MCNGNDFVVFMYFVDIQNCHELYPTLCCCSTLSYCHVVLLLCCLVVMPCLAIMLSCSQIFDWAHVNSAKEVLERLLIDNDAKQLDSIEFIQGKDTTVLKAIDLHTLEQDKGKLSNDTMDWIG
jgi:hypothetical protein